MASSRTYDDDYEDQSWISWFCARKGNEFFCEINEDYITDRFNMMGLSEMVTLYRQALEVILDDAPDESESAHFYYVPNELVQKSAEMLYGLIHARYVLSSEGLVRVIDKYRRHEYGLCPRVNCLDAHLLPIGLSDIPNHSTVKLYCPRCCDVYEPKQTRHSNIDGAYFGTGLPHMLLMAHPYLRPKPLVPKYEAKLFGFKIHPIAYELQRKEAARAESMEPTDR